MSDDDELRRWAEAARGDDPDALRALVRALDRRGESASLAAWLGAPVATLGHTIAEGPQPPAQVLALARALADAATAARERGDAVAWSDALVLRERGGELEVVAAPSGPPGPRWRAPELGADTPGDAADDAFAIGALLWACLTGEYPWPGAATPQPGGLPGPLAPTPDAARAVVESSLRWALAPDRDHRPVSPAMLVGALEVAVANGVAPTIGPVMMPAYGMPPRPERRSIFARLRDLFR